MSDRTLLEMAAKAAGYTCVWRGNDGDFWWHVDPDYERPWNPLSDDGDALRLAVNLKIGVCWWSDATVFSEYYGIDDDDGHRQLINESGNGLDEAATRRAIVRAAAAIWEKMP